MRSYNQMQAEIGEWSFSAFGFNTTPFLDVELGMGEDGYVEKGTASLGSLVPLMNIMDALGGLYAARSTGQAKTATGEIMIHLCDYCCRESIAIPGRVEFNGDIGLESVDALVVYLGQLFQAHVQRHQGIKDMNMDNVFNHHRMHILRIFVWHLNEYASSILEDDLLVVLNETWNLRGRSDE